MKLTQKVVEKAYKDFKTKRRAVHNTALKLAEAKRLLDERKAVLVNDGLSGSNEESRKADLFTKTGAERAAFDRADLEYKRAVMEFELAQAEVDFVKWSIRLSILTADEGLVGEGDE